MDKMFSLTFVTSLYQLILILHSILHYLHLTRVNVWWFLARITSQTLLFLGAVCIEYPKNKAEHNTN